MVLGVVFGVLFLKGGAAAQDMKMPEDAPVKIEADNMSYDNERDVYTAEGNVVITYGDDVLTAANVEYDRKIIWRPPGATPF